MGDGPSAAAFLPGPNSVSNWSSSSFGAPLPRGAITSPSSPLPPGFCRGAAEGDPVGRPPPARRRGVATGPATGAGAGAGTGGATTGAGGGAAPTAGAGADAGWVDGAAAGGAGFSPDGGGGIGGSALATAGEAAAGAGARVKTKSTVPMVAISRKATTPSAITSGREMPCCAGAGWYDGYGAAAKADPPWGAGACAGAGTSSSPLEACPLPPGDACPDDPDGRSRKPPPRAGICSFGPVSPRSERAEEGLERADISSFTSDASAEAAEGCQLPVSEAGSAPSPAAAMLTGISVRTLWDMPP